eukprot:CAMPEP_0179136164 /NCGR_PEP_ID=MMETSP0796-20121207/64869_1 /TAXON_ID=73915 /ORGANISM="Pyrodinium bahamense, Strain pbaha01" /LENGTH=119 /DNA_ID=CAMNT_0020835227 /DNA_START=294 /DNA_END=653 /DNA_ORIENTATION=-
MVAQFLEGGKEFGVQPAAPNMEEEVAAEDNVKGPAHLLRQRSAPGVACDSHKCASASSCPGPANAFALGKVTPQVCANGGHIHLEVTQHHLVSSARQENSSKARTARKVQHSPYGANGS